jgi:hypothetical protein
MGNQSGHANRKPPFHRFSVRTSLDITLPGTSSEFFSWRNRNGAWSAAPHKSLAARHDQHEVQELLVADLTTKTVTWFVRGDREFVVAEKSIFVGLSSDNVAHELGW